VAQRHRSTGCVSEYSATAMIAAAMLRGIRNGWLDRDDVSAAGR
jgi:rhamnogalacturonyl hydrolase YesR